MSDFLFYIQILVFSVILRVALIACNPYLPYLGVEGKGNLHKVANGVLSYVVEPLGEIRNRARMRHILRRKSKGLQKGPHSKITPSSNSGPHFIQTGTTAQALLTRKISFINLQQRENTDV